MRQYPENSGLHSEDNPPSPQPASVSERYAIVGEDSRQVPVQGLRVVKQTSLFLVMARDLTISPFATAYDSLIPTEPMVIDRAKQATFRVVYTPAEDDTRPILYPQVSQGENPTAWSFVEAEPVALTPLAGPPNPPTYVAASLGYFAKDPFANRGPMPAGGAEYLATFVLHPSDRFPACRMIRWVVRDTSLADPGTVTILGTQE